MADKAKRCRVGQARVLGTDTRSQRGSEGVAPSTRERSPQQLRVTRWDPQGSSLVTFSPSKSRVTDIFEGKRHLIPLNLKMNKLSTLKSPDLHKA